MKTTHKPCLHGDSDPVLDPDWLCLHEGILASNPDSDHLSHADCDPDSGPGARVNAPIYTVLHHAIKDRCK